MTEGRKTLSETKVLPDLQMRQLGPPRQTRSQASFLTEGIQFPRKGNLIRVFSQKAKLFQPPAGTLNDAAPGSHLPRLVQGVSTALDQSSGLNMPHVNWATWSTQSSLALVSQKSFILHGLRIWFLNSPLFPTKPHWNTCTAGLGQHVFYTNSQIARGMQLQTSGLHFIHPRSFSILQLRCPSIFMQRYRLPSSGTENKIQFPKLVTRSLAPDSLLAGKGLSKLFPFLFPARTVLWNVAALSDRKRAEATYQLLQLHRDAHGLAGKEKASGGLGICVVIKCTCTGQRNQTKLSWAGKSWSLVPCLCTWNERSFDLGGFARMTVSITGHFKTGIQQVICTIPRTAAGSNTPRASSRKLIQLVLEIFFSK